MPPQQRLRRLRDRRAACDAEHHLELALVPGQQPVDRVLGLQRPASASMTLLE
jgi:hypothetical protein